MYNLSANLHRNLIGCKSTLNCLSGYGEIPRACTRLSSSSAILARGSLLCIRLDSPQFSLLSRITHLRTLAAVRFVTRHSFASLAVSLIIHFQKHSTRVNQSCTGTSSRSWLSVAFRWLGIIVHAFRNQTAQRDRFSSGYRSRGTVLFSSHFSSDFLLYVGRAASGTWHLISSAFVLHPLILAARTETPGDGTSSRSDATSF